MYVLVSILLSLACLAHEDVLADCHGDDNAPSLSLDGAHSCFIRRLSIDPNADSLQDVFHRLLFLLDTNLSKVSRPVMVPF